MRTFGRLASFVFISSILISCTTFLKAPVDLPVSVSPPPQVKPSKQVHSQRLQPGMVSIPIVVSPTLKRIIPEGSRIVIAKITGRDPKCAEAVQDALMRRLIDNSDYEVLSRDNLDQIVGESDINWGGRFNTETAVKLGELLGASYFVVGRVVYCGITAVDARTEEEPDSKYSVFSVLQIIDIKTGKVVVSSAAEGRYSPLPASALYAAQSAGGPTSVNSAPSAEEMESPTDSARNPFQAVLSGFRSSSSDSSPIEVGPPTPKKKRVALEPQDYAMMKSAEDMASGFADNFFARSTWENVEMWDDQGSNRKSVRYVKLGHCPEARSFLDEVASKELPYLKDLAVAVAKYLHNYGVALLCENNSDLAIQKLQSAYRIDGNPSTLRMLGLANKIKEWSLRVEVDREPLVNMLLKTDSYDAKN